MSTNTPTEVSSFDGRTIEGGRFHRAATEAMTVTFTAPGVASVDSSSGNTYDVDLVSGACTCPDHARRGTRFICKHAQRASLVALFDAGQRSTELVACVARAARDRGCEHDVDWCAGPTTHSAAVGGYPCPGCVEAAGGDDWAVWTALCASPDGEDTDTEIDTDADASEARSVVDPYADRVAEREAVDETPL